MKNKIFLIALLFLAISFSKLHAESDTLWTRRYDIPGEIKNAIFSPDDSKILVTGTETFFEVNPENGEIIRELPEYTTGIIDINPKANIGINYLCQLVDLNTYKVIKNIVDTSKYKIYSYDGVNLNFTFNKELNKIAFVNYSYPIGNGNYHQNNVIIDLLTGKETIIEKEFGDNEGSAALSISPDGKYLSTLTYYFGQNQDPTDDYIMLSLYDLETNIKIKKITFPMDYANIWTMKFSPDASMLAIENGFVNIYSTPNLELIDKFQFIPNLAQIKDYKFTDDNKFIIICGIGTPMQKISIKENKLIESYLYLFGNKGIIIPNILDSILLSHGSIGLYCYNNKITSVQNSNLQLLYPNPTTGQLIIKSQIFQKSNFKLQINNNIGQNIITKEYQQTYEDITLDVSNFPIGNYYINIEINNKIVETLKFIKE